MRLVNRIPGPVQQVGADGVPRMPDGSLQIPLAAKEGYK